MPYAKLTRLKVTIITLIFCLKTYKWRWMEILWRSALFFWPKALVWRGSSEPTCKPALFCHILGSACSHTRKAAKLYGERIQCSCETLGSVKSSVLAWSTGFTFEEGNWGTGSVANAQRQQSSLDWSLEICRHANERPQADKKVIYFHFSFLRVLFWELHLNGAIGVSRSLCCSWALLPLLLDL